MSLIRHPGRLLACGLVAALLSGCGVVWDSDGHRHALGIGYVSWPLPDERKSAVVHGSDVVGVALLATATSKGLTIGYSSERMVAIDGDRVVVLDCLQCDLAEGNPGGGRIKEEEEKTE